MEDLELLRRLCDNYYDPRFCECGGARTSFDVDSRSDIRDLAEFALNFYNEKEQKNFHLEKVCMLNIVFYTHYCYCMQFWARSAESDELRLFRGVVDSDKVLLCEIKDGDEMTIPADHDENYQLEPDHDEYYHLEPERIKMDLTDGSTVEVGGSAGRGVVNPVSVNGSDVASATSGLEIMTGPTRDSVASTSATTVYVSTSILQAQIEHATQQIAHYTALRDMYQSLLATSDSGQKGGDSGGVLDDANADSTEDSDNSVDF